MTPLDLYRRGLRRWLPALALLVVGGAGAPVGASPGIRNGP